MGKPGIAMPGMPRRLWAEMTTRDFEALDRERVIAVLPVGAIEQHGPHLPVCVDACLCQAVVEARDRPAARGSAGHLPAALADRQVERAHRFPGHAHAFGRDL